MTVREAAAELVRAYDACRDRNSMSGFWTHLDDLRKALAADEGAEPSITAECPAMIVDVPTTPEAMAAAGAALAAAKRACGLAADEGGDALAGETKR